MLQNERNSLNGLARDIISGSIKNLASNLYTSSIHYLYEILQNFEDAIYKDEGIVEIYVDKSCIIFANNETGFTANDVYSICNLSNSEKQLHTHIGNKGIGFKSVFLCSNNPIIVSKPSWSFQFRLDDSDSLSYIKPLSIDTENLPELLKKFMNNNENLTTFIYLPFKEEYGNEYFERLYNSIDENILLFTKKIEKLVIEDKINDINISIRRKLTVENEAFHDNIKIKRAILFKNDETLKEFRLFEISGTNRSDDIVFAFPLNVQNTDHYKYSIYSVFPIYDLKLKFLISSYWILTTNRETVNEYNTDNLQLKKRLIKILFDIIENDELISRNILSYLPINDPHLTLWWKGFIFEFEKKIKLFIQSKLSNVRIYDENINRLVDRNEFKLINIEIVDNYNENLSFYICKVSVNDLLTFLQSQYPSLIELNEKWWEDFFKLLNSYNVKFNETIIFASKIFLIESQRQPLKNIEKCFLNNYKSDFKSTCRNHEICLVEYASDNEKIFLKENLGLKEINEELIFKAILDDHLNEQFTTEILTDDMKFIKNNFNAFTQYATKVNKYCLCLPIKDAFFAVAENATISTLFSVDLTSGIPLMNKKESYKFIAYPTNDLKQCLEYEIFCLKLKCRLPEINGNLLEEKIKLREATLPLLNIFQSELTDTEINLANELFDLLPCEYIKETIHKLPVKIKDEDDIVSIADTCSNSTDSGYHSINVETRSKELAKRFGIKETMNKKPEPSNEHIESNTCKFDFSSDEANIPRNSKNELKNKSKKSSILNSENLSENVDTLIEFYKKRIEKQQPSGGDHTNRRVIEARREGNNIIFNFERRLDTGCRAELYFYLHLKHNLNENLNIENYWFSSLRTRIFPNSSANCDDTKGYDFEVIDNKNLFSPQRSKKCLIEVKGFSNEWEGTFVLTKNEVKRKEQATREYDELYIIVIIEHVENPDKTHIAEIINWIEDEIELVEAESFKYKIK